MESLVSNGYTIDGLASNDREVTSPKAFGGSRSGSLILLLFLGSLLLVTTLVILSY